MSSMFAMRKSVRECAARVAQQLGVGHSERIYQKALSIELQKSAIIHSPEYHVPIRYDDMSLGSERADILIEDKNHLLYVLELKATEASIWKRSGPPSIGDNFPPAHAQLLKYVRFLQQSERRRVCTGFIVNFRQTLLYASEKEDADIGAVLRAACPVEMDMYDVQTGTWEFGLFATDTDSQPPSPSSPSIQHKSWCDDVLIDTSGAVMQQY